MAKFSGTLPFFLPLVFVLVSCLTLKENTYVNMTYEEIVKKKGNPSYVLYEIIGQNYHPADYEPDFTQFFDEEELKATVTVKYGSWKKSHSTLLVWFKEVAEDEWIAFYSTQYRGPFLK